MVDRRRLVGTRGQPVLKGADLRAGIKRCLTLSGGNIRAQIVMASIALTACAGSPRGPKAALTRFPIGIYAVDRPEYLARLKADGFDSFQTYRRDPVLLAALAKEAKRQGMRMVVYPDEVRNGKLSLTRGWPIDAWYIMDEPDVVKMSSNALREISDRTRSWDPARPQAYVIGQGAPAKVYAEIGDIVMLDWYPIPHMAADSVADQVDLVMGAIPRGKPLWMVVQAYDWADEIKDPEKRKRLRFPSHSEIRFMSYLSVLHGARGLFYFCLQKKGTTLFDYPELWQVVARIAREMKEMQSVFERGGPIPLPFEPNPDGVEARAWHYRGRDYVVIVNRRRGVKLKLPGVMLEARWRLIFEDGRDPKQLLDKYMDALYIPPYRVLVFRS